MLKTPASGNDTQYMYRYLPATPSSPDPVADSTVTRYISPRSPSPSLENCMADILVNARRGDCEHSLKITFTCHEYISNQLKVLGYSSYHQPTMSCGCPTHVMNILATLISEQSCPGWAGGEGHRGCTRVAAIHLSPQ